MAHQQHDKSNTAARQSPYQLVCDRLRAHGSKDKQKGLHKSNWSCPVCEDGGLHLGVEEVAGGKVLLNCFHGCSPDAIVAALGLRLADLFAEKRKRNQSDEPLTLRAYLQAKKLDPAIADTAGLADGFDQYERPCLLIPYRDENGKQIALHYRYRLQGGKEGRFGWPKGTKAKGLLYGRERLPEARAAKRALLFEGESDPQTCWQHKLPAFGVPGADMVNPKRLAKDFAGIDRLYVGNERDRGAPGFLRSLAAADGLAERVWVLDLSPHKDPSELHCADPAGFNAVMEAAMAAARPLAEVLAELARAAPELMQKAASSGEETRRYHRSDLGNAELLRDLCGDRVRFVWYGEKTGEWRAWDDTRWRTDQDGQMGRLAADVVRERYRRAADLPDSDSRHKEAEWAFSSESLKRRRDMLASAASLEGIASIPSQYDQNPLLLNVLNGTIDLRTGKLLDHDPTRMLSKMAPVKYDAGAKCPRFLRFLEEIFDGRNDVIGFVQRAVGYSLTGDTSEECLFILYGTGRNGKGKLLGVLQGLLGEYWCNTPFDLFTQDREKWGGPRNDLARLHGARLVTASETSEGVRLSEAVVKALTGRDTITARFLHKEFFDFEPVAKYWLAVNHKPRVRDTSPGFWSRVRLVPFEVSFWGREDKHLGDTLREERSGVLNWALIGCLEWQRRGELGVPEEVTQATAIYRSEEDPVARFVDECCVISDGAGVGATELYQAFESWCERAGEEHQSQQRFGRAMGEKEYESYRHEETRLWRYKGIGLLETRRDNDP